jgi:hypothetical protein
MAFALLSTPVYAQASWIVEVPAPLQARIKQQLSSEATVKLPKRISVGALLPDAVETLPTPKEWGALAKFRYVNAGDYVYFVDDSRRVIAIIE